MSARTPGPGFSIRRALDSHGLEMSVAAIFLVTAPRFVQLALTWNEAEEKGTITALPIPLVLMWSTLIFLSGLGMATAMSLRVVNPTRAPLDIAALILGITGWGIFAICTFASQPAAWWSWSWIVLLTAGLALRLRKVARTARGLSAAGGAQ